MVTGDSGVNIHHVIENVVSAINKEVVFVMIHLPPMVDDRAPVMLTVGEGATNIPAYVSTIQNRNAIFGIPLIFRTIKGNLF